VKAWLTRAVEELEYFSEPPEAAAGVAWFQVPV
jgi:hypothetical protein